MIPPFEERGIAEDMTGTTW